MFGGIWGRDKSNISLHDLGSVTAAEGRGLHHFANGGSWYVSSNKLGTLFDKKGGHLLGNVTSLCLHGPACEQVDRGGGRRVG